MNESMVSIVKCHSDTSKASIRFFYFDNLEQMFTYIDLFAGCGGISVGLERAGGQLIVASEKSPMAAETYFRNLISPECSAQEFQELLSSSRIDQVDKKIVIGPLRNLLDDREALGAVSKNIAASTTNGLDLIVGGPPCQGFSLAGRRNRDDSRNSLPWEFLEVVELFSPKVVVIENVVGMGQKFANQEESSFHQLQQALKETGPGYLVQSVLANAEHFGAPQHRPRLMILGLRKDLVKQDVTYTSDSMWKSTFADKVLEVLPPKLAPVAQLTSVEAPTLGDAIWDLDVGQSPTNVQISAKYLSQMKSPDLWGLRSTLDTQAENHVFRKHNERTTRRFRLYQALSKAGIPEKLIPAFSSGSISEQELEERLGVLLPKFPLVSGDGKIVAEGTHELIAEIKTLQTKKHSQRALKWHMPSRTVVTLPDDYIHPIKPRVLTVRELARVQGFPDAFKFYGKETTGADRRKSEVPQYSQVGNAVSPFLGFALGKMMQNLGVITNS